MTGDDESLLDRHFTRIVALASDGVEVDFRHYRPEALRRRIRARLALLSIANESEYARRLETDTRERVALGEFFLISTTEMFRDRIPFQSLRTLVLPQLIEHRSQQRARLLRGWVAGCSTGLEAYSLAACALAEVARQGSELSVRILATDVNVSSLERASRGIVPEGQIANVPSDLRDTYFEESGGIHRAGPKLMQALTFERHDLLDPDRIAPSSAVVASFDLVACRNVLIYLDAAAQRRVWERLLKACAPGAILFSGTAEALPNSMSDLAHEWVRGTGLYVRA